MLVLAETTLFLVSEAQSYCNKNSQQEQAPKSKENKKFHIWVSKVQHKKAADTSKIPCYVWKMCSREELLFLLTQTLH